MRQQIDEIYVVGKETYFETGKIDITKTVRSDDSFNVTVIQLKIRQLRTILHNLK